MPAWLENSSKNFVIGPVVVDNQYLDILQELPVQGGELD